MAGEQERDGVIPDLGVAEHGAVPVAGLQQRVEQIVPGRRRAAAIRDELRDDAVDRGKRAVEPPMAGRRHPDRQRGEGAGTAEEFVDENRIRLLDGADVRPEVGAE